MTLKMLGIGDNVADYYTHINTIYPGGCAYNFSVYASMLGADSAYLGIVGDDFAGRHILTTARGLGVDTKRCRILHGASPLPAVRIKAGERIFEGCNEHGVWERPLILSSRDLDYISGFHLVHTSLYGGMEQNLEILAETGVPLSMDFGTTYSDVFFEAHCPNLTFAIMSCGHMSERETKIQMEKTFNFGAKHVIATRGAEGAFFYNGAEFYHRPAQMIKAKDTMGAGDSFLTAFLKSYMEWNYNSKLSDEKVEYSSVVRTALDDASRFSAKVCGLDGSFGQGITYIEDVVFD